jgi:DNA repair protein RadC
VLGPRQVFRPLLLNACSAFILVHNHPSGEPTPSSEDVTITARLRKVGELVGVSLLDHVIVSAGGHFSFADAGLLAA